MNSWKVSCMDRDIYRTHVVECCNSLPSCLNNNPLLITWLQISHTFSIRHELLFLETNCGEGGAWEESRNLVVEIFYFVQELAGIFGISCNSNIESSCSSGLRWWYPMWLLHWIGLCLILGFLLWSVVPVALACLLWRRSRPTCWLMAPANVV